MLKSLIILDVILCVGAYDRIICGSLKSWLLTLYSVGMDSRVSEMESICVLRWECEEALLLVSKT